VVRTVDMLDGRGYTHRCTREVYERVAHAVEEIAKRGATLDLLVEHLDAPSTQVAVAPEFLKERGCVVTRLRKSYPASTFLFEDARVEYLALAEGE
jgi:hypothetical protein